MNFFDIIFIVIIIVLFIFAIRKGALRELLSVLGCFAGYVAAEKYFMSYYHHLLPYISNQLFAKITTYISLFLLGLIIGGILSWLAKAMLSNRPPIFLSRIVASGFSIAKSILIAFVIIFTVQTSFQNMLGDDLIRSFVFPTLLKIKGFVSTLIY